MRNTAPDAAAGADADTDAKTDTYSDKTLPNAGVIRRLGSMVYDSLLIFAVLFAATIPALLLAPPSAPVANGAVVHELNPLASGWPFQLYLLAVYCGFFCFFWQRNGQTLGMQAWRLEVQNLQGERLNFSRSLLRIAAAAISILCAGLGYWWIWIDKENRSWHDRWTKTRVVVHPKKT